MAVPDLDGLRTIRALLIEPDFIRELEEVISRSHNRPEARLELKKVLLAIKHGFRDQHASRNEDHFHTTAVVTGGGLAIGTGGILALLTQTALYPLFPLLPIATGCYAIWRGMQASRRLSSKLSAIEDIVDTLDGHMEALGQKG